uniref:Uncharacterized protein n=1 Tax=Arundo donax TaxID=35708 RepID=A0A0A9HTG9_ARUDO
MAAMLRRTYAQAEALAADRARLKILVENRHARVELLQARIQQMRRREARRRRAEKAAADALLGVKELEARRYQKLAELTESDMEDLRMCVAALAAENSKLKKKTEGG